MKIPTTYLNSKASSSNQITKFNKAIYFQYFTTDIPVSHELSD